MYLPSHFEQHDTATLHALIRAHPLATLVSTGPEGPTADHVPLAFDAGAGAHGALLGHVARANPLWTAAAGSPVLAVFHGPQAYVSPSWYPGKATTHKVVPTWNYAVVHAHGVLRAVDDAPWLHELVRGLTDTHEAARERLVPVHSVDKAVVAAERADLVEGDRVDPFAERLDAPRGRDDVRPAHVNVDVGEHLGQRREHVLIGAYVENDRAGSPRDRDQVK